jgi:hypothetical protein
MSAPERDEDREYREWCVDGLLGAPVSARLSKQERDKFRRFAVRQQSERALIEAEIAKLEKSGEEINEAQLEDLGLYVSPLSPAMQFIVDRLKGVTPREFDTKAKLAMVALVKSKVPLDPQTRRLIAGDLYGLYFPNPARDRRAKQQNENAVIENMRRELLSRGMTAAEVEREIVKALGIKSVAALRKRMQRRNRRTEI